MLTRVLLPRGGPLSVGRLFATSVPRWNVPTSAAPLDADVIKTQLKTMLQSIQKAKLQVLRLAAQLKTTSKERKSFQKAQLNARKWMAANIVARKAKRVAVLDARWARREEKLIAKSKEIRSQYRACKQKLIAKLKKLRWQYRSCKSSQLVKRKKVRAQYRARKEKLIAKLKKARAQFRARKNNQLVKRKKVCAQHRARKEKLIAKLKKVRAKASIKEQRIAEIIVARKAKASLKEFKYTFKASLEKVSLKDLKNSPWQKFRKLPSCPFGVYTAVHFASAVQPSEKIGVTMFRIHNQYKALTADQRLPYEEQAAANLKVRVEVTAKIQGLKASPYALFIKDEFKQTADSMSGKPSIRKDVLVMKALDTKYKALSSEERAVHEVKAESIRAEAQKILSEMA